MLVGGQSPIRPFLADSAFRDGKYGNYVASVRGYQGIFITRAAQRPRVTALGPVSWAASLYIATLGVNILICRK
jgi:hypothetical protein